MNACTPPHSQVSVRFCDAHGRPRLDALRQTPAAATGGFLYISSVMVKPEHRVDGDTSIGAEAVFQLLTVEPSVAGQWTLAVYIPGTLLSPGDQARLDTLRQGERSIFMGGPGATTTTTITTTTAAAAATTTTTITLTQARRRRNRQS